MSSLFFVEPKIIFEINNPCRNLWYMRCSIFTVAGDSTLDKNFFFSTSKFDKIISSSHHLWFFSVFFFLRHFLLFCRCYSYKIFGNYNHYTVDFMSGAIKKLNLFAFYMKGKWTFITICEVYRIDNNHPYVQFRTRNLFSLSVTFELFEPKDVFVWLEPLNFFRERSYRHL